MIPSRLAIAFLCLTGCTSYAADIKVIASGSPSASVRILASSFEKSFGHKITVTSGNPGSVVSRLRDGEMVDVAVLPVSMWDRVLKIDRVDAASRRSLARAEMGVGIKAGSTKPPIANATEYRNTLLAARSIGIGDRNGGSPPTTALLAVLRKENMEAQVLAKAKSYSSGAALAHALVDGEIEFGMTMIPELISVKGVEVAGKVPNDFLNYSGLSLVVLLKDTSQPAVAQQFLEYLTSADAKVVFRSNGMNPD